MRAAREEVAMRDCCRIRAVDIAALLLIAVYALAALAGVLEISANGTELDLSLIHI